MSTPPAGTHRRRRPPPYEDAWLDETGDRPTCIGDAMYVRTQAVGHVLDTLARLRAAHDRVRQECVEQREQLAQQRDKIGRLRQAFIEREAAYQRLLAEREREEHAAA